MTQADLFSSPDTEPFIRRARVENPASSHIAAAEIEETAESQCARILAAVIAHPDVTTQELAPFVKLSVHTVGRRLPELRTKKLIHNPITDHSFGEGDGAMRMRRCTVQNRLALTWRAV